jgi:putative oxidoreductase
MKDFALLLGRIFISAIFIFSAVTNLANFAHTKTYMAQTGLPAPGFLLLCSMIIIAVGGILILVGKWTAAGAALLIIFMIPATLIFHHDFSQFPEIIQFLKNLGMIGGLLFVWVFGPGRLSISARRKT